MRVDCGSSKDENSFEEWGVDYGSIRPHTSLGGLSPTEPVVDSRPSSEAGLSAVERAEDSHFKWA